MGGDEECLAFVQIDNMPTSLKRKESDPMDAQFEWDGGSVAGQQPTYFAVAAAVLIFLSLVVASPWSIFRPRILKNGDGESDLIAMADPDLDSCQRFNPFWAKIRKEFYKSAGHTLTYPGNEAAPGLSLLREPHLDLYQTSPEEPHPSEKLPEASPPRFIYLVQGPEGLPRELTTVCGPNSSVIMLSYLEDRADTLFVPKSSWTKGRNVLFAAALRLEQYQGWRFTYYVFMDDDPRLAFGTWRDFENFLLSYLPAMAAPYMHAYTLPANGNFSHVQQPSAESLEAAWAEAHQNSTQENASSVYFFDAIVTAYHREAAVQLLPYSTVYDQDSWWISHFIQCHRGALLYHGHVLMYYGVRITNPEHREYRRRLRLLRQAEKAVLEGARVYNNSAIDTCWRQWRPKSSAHQVFGNVEEKRGAYDDVDYSNAKPCVGDAYMTSRKKKGHDGR